MPIDTQMVSLCRDIATKAHAGQLRRDGMTPYITHPEAVAVRVRHLGQIYECVALLHDVLEDAKLTVRDLRDQGVEHGVVARVLQLTRDPDESYSNYLARVYPDRITREVKIADILHNLSSEPTVGQVKKYAAALLFLVN